MFCSKSLLVVLIFSVALRAAIAVDPLYHFCYDKENYSTPSPYYDDMGKLLRFLPTEASSSGFAIDSVGRVEAPVYVLALCRGDVSSSNCKSCIEDARSELLDRCPNQNKEAIIWYDYCLLKYNDAYFFGEIDYRNNFSLWNVNEVKNPKKFNNKTKEFLTKLADKAYESPKLYATGETKIKVSTKLCSTEETKTKKSKTLYGLVQCTRDLKPLDCKQCLYDAIGKIPKCCDGKQGGRIVGGSCNFRYELYPFVES